MKNDLIVYSGLRTRTGLPAGLRFELQTLSRAKAAVKNALNRL